MDKKQIRLFLERFFSICGLMFFIGCIGYLVASSAQTNGVKPAKQAYSLAIEEALLKEIRELRLAIQKSNAIMSRTQIASDRLRLQQERVDSLLREQDALNQQIKETERNLAKMSERAKDLEMPVTTETGPS